MGFVCVGLFLKVGHHRQLFLAVEAEILLASGRITKRDVHRYIWSRSHVSILSLDKNLQSSLYLFSRIK